MSDHATGVSAPIIPTNPDLRMNSLEIAELMNKRHRYVMRDIKKHIDEDTINERRFARVEYRDAKGEMRPMYLLDFQATMILITGYDAKRRAAVIVRQRTGTDFMDYFGIHERDLAETRHLGAAAATAGADNLAPAIEEFLETCCRVDDEQRVQATYLYHRFVSWLDVSFSLTGGRLAYVPSQKAFGGHLSARFKKVKSAGRVHYVGVALLESGEEVTA